MVGHRSTGLPECGPTESSAPEPCLFPNYECKFTTQREVFTFVVKLDLLRLCSKRFFICFIGRLIIPFVVGKKKLQKIVDTIARRLIKARNKHACLAALERNLFEILLNPPEIRLYSTFSD